MKLYIHLFSKDSVDGEIMKNVNDLIKELLTEEAQDPKRKELEPGLTRKEAMKRFPWRASMGDCRGFSYDPKSGIATWM
jgi:hypothetical protein